MNEGSEKDVASQIDSIAEHVEQRFRAGRRVLSFRVPRALRERPRPLLPRRQPLPARRVRPLRHGQGALPVGRVHALQAVRLPWEASPRGAGCRAARSSARSTCRRRFTARSPTSSARAGPTGSCSSTARTARPSRTIAQCMMAALENYSTLDEGALYRFHWVFPSQKTVRGSLGFAQRRAPRQATQIVRAPARRGDRRQAPRRGPRPPALPHPDGRPPALLEGAYRARPKAAQPEPPNEWILRGQLSHKSQQVFEALLASYDGSYAEVLKHVQVERYFISRRYRTGAVTIGPQLSVDAGERQVTMDRSLAVAAGVAPGGDPLRGEGRARRRGGRPARVQRSSQAAARRLQVPPAHRWRRARSR